MYDKTRKGYYWLHMANHVHETVKDCLENRLDISGVTQRHL